VITAVAFSPDGQRILSGSMDGTLKLWDIESGRELQTFCGHHGGVQRVAFSADGRRAISAGSDGLVQIWPVNSTGDTRPATGLSGMHLVTLSPDGRLALEGNFRGSNSWARLWDTATGCDLGGWKHDDSLQCLALSPDDRLSLAGQDKGLIVLRDLASGRILKTLSGHTGPVYSVAFANDSARCVSCGDDGTVRLWDLVSGVERGRIATSHSRTIVRISPDNQWVALACYSSELAVWQLTADGKWSAWETSQGKVNDVAWSADSRRLITAGADKTVKIWEVATQREIATNTLDNPQFSVALGQGGQFAFTGDLFGWINCLEVATGRVLAPLRVYGSIVLSLGISADGLKLLSTSSGQATLWDFSRVAKYADFESRLAAVRTNLSAEHPTPEQLSVFGEWYAFCGFPDLGAGLLDRARSAGASVSALTLARCHWQMNDFEAARREFQSATDRQEAPDVYLQLCRSAVSNKRVYGYRIAGDEVIFEFDPAAYDMTINADDPVYVAGDFNQWLGHQGGGINKPDPAWQMQRVAPNRYELHRKLADFSAHPFYNFKFVENANQWFDAPSWALNRIPGDAEWNLTLKILSSNGSGK